MAFQEDSGALARRVPVGSYESYAEAQQAVDLLSDEGFPVGQVSIVGSGLRYVEQVAGRVTTARAALAGAGQGLFLGLMFGLLFGIFFTVVEAFIGVVVYGAVLGALLGAVLGALSHAATGGRRDFASVSGMQAERYEVMADPEVAERARGLLTEKLPARRSEPA